MWVKIQQGNRDSQKENENLNKSNKNFSGNQYQ
jgi:hypothetical protein